ncbi:60S ribosomal protein L37a-like [Hyaena hyaena]|uniref:60S ribosomal protein L37a-like n=1 Tax=Hyaena hyaena TaxID=95912 RepID=UPI001924B785|nr:60S ribosomal protein L37a-like [Hyaena hyaena]
MDLAGTPVSMLSCRPEGVPPNQYHKGGSVNAPALSRLRPSLWHTAKYTKKVAIISKHRTHYVASLRKMAKKNEISQHTKYTCSFCGKPRWGRHVVGIWHRGSCMKMVAGGAWTCNTTCAVTVKFPIGSMKEFDDQ